jgi:hypothetical protein
MSGINNGLILALKHLLDQIDKNNTDNIHTDSIRDSLRELETLQKKLESDEPYC